MQKLLSLFLIYLFLFPMLASPVVSSAQGEIYFAEDSKPRPSTSDPTSATSPGSGYGNTAPPKSSGGAATTSNTADNVSQPSRISPAGSGGGQGQVVNGVPQRNELVCDSSELSPQETQNLIDLLKKGFTVDGNNGIVGIPRTDMDRDRLASNEIILQDPQDANIASKATIPNLKMKPQEIAQFLNTYVKGPFAFGVVLDDSLRAGRCKDVSSPGCTLLGPNLRYRNSGAGIVADTKPVREVFGDIMGTWTDKNKVKEKSQFSKEDDEVLRAALSTDVNGDDTKVKTAKRLEKQLIPNSILADSFDAKLATNCTSSACVISTYSLFDKYFNSWMSSEMVASTFGPSLLYYTKRLFGWTGRRGFLSGVRDEYQSFLDIFRKKYLEPDSYLQRLLTKRIHNRLDKYGWREWWMSGASGNANGTGYNFVKTEEFQHFWAKAQEPNGFLSHIKTVEERAEFIRMLSDMRSLVRGAVGRQDEKKAAWELAEKTFGPGSPVTRQKYVEYGQEFAKLMMFWDDVIYVDVPEWAVRHPNLGMYNKGFLQVRPDGGSEVIDMFKEHRNFQRIVRKFAKDGTFRDFEKKASEGYDHVFKTSGDNLVYYTFDKDTAKESVPLSWGNIKPQATLAPNRTQRWIQDDYGDYLPYTDVSAEFIQSRLSRGAQVFQGNWKEAGEITPLDFTARITNGRTRPNITEIARANVDQMLDTVKERNWVSRRYWNALDKLMAQEDELVKSYFSIKGGAKWTTIPFGYWWAKKGFGVEGISQYQLPDTWHDIKVTHGKQQVYDYSYIDFFANEGSDQGDIFVQVLNKLPWKIILDNLSERYNPVKNLYDMITNHSIRNETESLAFYLTGPDECVGCTIVMPTEDLQEFRPFFYVDNRKMVSYILEDTKSETAKEKGQTLIAFAGHTNLEGKSGNSEGKKIDLVEAINGKGEDKTCTKAVEDLHFYGLNIGKKLPKYLTEKGRIGGVLGGLESVTYATFLWAGIFSTAAIQISIAPQLHGCIDTDEGYYIHYFMPAPEKKGAQSSASEKSSEKVQKLVKNAKEKLFDQFSSEGPNFATEAKDKIGAELDKFTNDAKQNSIVQATLRFDGTSSGQIRSSELFYLWFGKGADINPASYRDKGMEELRGVNDINVGLDFGKGQITENGKVIVDKPDNVRLAPINLAIPAVEIPHTVTQTCLESRNEKVIEISAQGEVKVLDKDLLNCIKGGVLEQTGLPLTGDRLNEAFGKLEVVVTTTHPNVKPNNDRIIAEGIPRKVAEGRNATITIYANKDVNLSNSNDGSTSIGRLESLQFANGLIVVKPDGCFLTWLKHHEDGILSKDLVKGLKTSLDRSLNNETMCEEPAINMELVPDVGSDFKVSKVDKFNTALKHQGPFTVFETPTKRYVISAEKDDKGVCRDHLRVIDKATGKVEDYVGSITQTPEGLKIRTDDGKEHELKFSTKDGAPFVQLDNNKPELLTSAQGKNGAFYYDPEKGLWFAENANLLPLIDAFRQGIAAKVGSNGEATASAQGNVLNLQVGGKGEGSFLNLPSLPESPVVLAIFIAILMVSFAWARRKGMAENSESDSE